MDFKKDPTTNFGPVDKINRKQAQEEAAALREGIHYHDYLYYIKNQPEVSDAVYDRLFHRLQELESSFPDLQTEDSPARRVGTPLWRNSRK
jgi:DNA ligase (NAD+)